MVQQNNEIERNWRDQRGAGANTPPGMLGVSTSEGDKNRNSLGPARFVGAYVRYVANDDGSPVAEETNRRIVALFEETERTNELLQAILDELKAQRAG